MMLYELDKVEKAVLLGESAGTGVIAMSTEAKHELREQKKHSPLPWTQHCFLIKSAKGDHVTHCGMGNLPPSRSTESEANAEFITRAANSYYDMVSALKACEAIFVKGMKSTTDVEWDDAFGKVSAALAAAQE